MFQVHCWPNAILHIDGDAFFASVMQAIRPELKDKPIVVGRERGIATAISYRAKEYGIKRGMRKGEILKLCANCQFIESDYKAFELFSRQMFSILRTFSPQVEKYSVDEGFADLKGLQRPLNMSYRKIGRAIKNKVEASLGITVSVGVSITKSLAKLASSANKPSGLTIVNGLHIEDFLKNIELKDIWGIGTNTSAYLKKMGINCALDFANKPEAFVKNKLAKNYLEIWHELKGNSVYKVNTSEKDNFKSITRSKTFYPATNDAKMLWAKLRKHIEKAFFKARNFGYLAGEVVLFLKGKDFKYRATKIKLNPKTNYPLIINEKLKRAFLQIYRDNVLYRSAGCRISDFVEDNCLQQSLFYQGDLEEKAEKIYPLWEEGKVDFGTALYDNKRINDKKESKMFDLPVMEI